MCRYVGSGQRRDDDSRVETVSCPESSSCHGPQLGTCHKDILSVYLSAVFMYLLSSGCVAAEGRPPPADCQILVLVTTVPSTAHHSLMTAISHHLIFAPVMHCRTAVLQRCSRDLCSSAVLCSPVLSTGSTVVMKAAPAPAFRGIIPSTGTFSYQAGGRK